MKQVCFWDRGCGQKIRDLIDGVSSDCHFHRRGNDKEPRSQHQIQTRRSPTSWHTGQSLGICRHNLSSGDKWRRKGVTKATSRDKNDTIWAPVREITPVFPRADDDRHLTNINQKAKSNHEL